MIVNIIFNIKSNYVEKRIAISTFSTFSILLENFKY